MSDQTPPAPKTNAERRSSVTIYSHSPVVYFYPSTIAAFIFGLMSGIEPTANNGGLFLSLFFFNMLIILFDFSSYRSAFITLALSVVGLLLWHFGGFEKIFVFMDKIDIRINRHGFFAFGIFLLLMQLGDFVWAHLNRWIFSANEIKHVRVLEGEESFPGRGVTLRREISDIFEYILGFGAGTVLLSTGKKTIRLNNVLGAQSKIVKIESFIRSSGIYSDDADVFALSVDAEDDNNNA
jgi:hypothetical protein